MDRKVVQIDCSQIPSTDLKNLATTFLAAVTKFYEDPGNDAAFQEWKKRRYDNKNS